MGLSVLFLALLGAPPTPEADLPARFRAELIETTVPAEWRDWFRRYEEALRADVQAEIDCARAKRKFCKPLTGIGPNEMSLGQAAGGPKNHAYLTILWNQVYGVLQVRLKQSGGVWTNNFHKACTAAFPAERCRDAYLPASFAAASRPARR